MSVRDDIEFYYREEQLSRYELELGSQLGICYFLAEQSVRSVFWCEIAPNGSHNSLVIWLNDDMEQTYMIYAKFQHGINSSNEKLIHLTLSIPPKISGSIELVENQFVFMDDSAAKLVFGALREIPIPRKITKFIKDQPFVLCTFEINGYQETIFDQNHQVLSHQRLGI